MKPLIMYISYQISDYVTCSYQFTQCARYVRFNVNMTFSDLSPAAKELKALIEMHLSDELKRLRSSVDEQLKNTEEVFNKKIDAIEGGNKSGKGGRGSSRGKKK